MRIKAWEADKTSVTWVDLCREVTKLKKQEEFNWLNKTSSVALQQAVKCTESAFENFFKKKSGFPRFKSKRSKQTCKFIQNITVDFEKQKIRLPKIGWIRVFIDRPFEGKIGTVTVSKNKAGKYFVSICYKTDKPLPLKPSVKEQTTIGVDVGLKHFAVLSNGEKIENPKHLQKLEQRLKVLQRRYARTKKGSNRREAARLRLAKLHYKIACQRADFLHKLSSRLIRENQSIVIEDLNVSGMVKNHSLAKAISSVSWSEFFRQLKYKADYQGKNLITIGRFEPTSKKCSVCNEVKDSLELSERHWTCLGCGTYHDRDLNAALNIKNLGLKKSGEAIAVGDVELLPLGGAVKRQGRKDHCLFGANEKQRT